MADAKPQLKQVSNWFGAAVAIIGNALPYLTPDFLSSIGLSPTTVHTVSSIVAVILIAYREKQKPPSVTVDVPPSKQGGFITRNFAAFLGGVALISAVAFAMGGCAFTSALIAPAAMPLEQAAIGAAVFTAETANKATAATQAARAATINKVAKQILAVDQNTSMALTDVELIVNAKVQALGLPAADLLVANLLTAALGQALQAQLAVTTKGAISPQTQVAVAAVCNWIIADTGG